MQDCDLPLSIVRIFGFDEKENVRDCVLEYELPINFNYAILGDEMSALQIHNGEFLGFFFRYKEEREEFDKIMAQAR